MRWTAFGAAILLAGCAATSTLDVDHWYEGKRFAPQGDKVWVCHGFGCNYKDVVVFSRADVAAMRKIMGRPKSAAAERKRVERLIAWAERRVAPVVGSADDVPGLDISNARKRGQMDCIDEATNTTSYLLVAHEHGLLRFHEVARPVARGFFLDGRYPHATAVLRAENGSYAVDSWPVANGERPRVMPLEAWYAQARAQ